MAKTPVILEDAVKKRIKSAWRQGMSKRDIFKRFGINWKTLDKLLNEDKLDFTPKSLV